MADIQCRGYAGSIPVYCSHDKIVPTGDVKPNPKNPNQHPESQIEMLAKIITTQGWRAPVTVSTRSGLVVRGHGRLMAAKFAGLEFVPVDFQHYESNDAELADLLADNKIAELSEIDNKLLADVFADIDTSSLDVDLTGYTEKEYKGIMEALVKATSEPEMKDPDGAVALPKVPASKIGDVWRLGRHRLMCGDSTDAESVGVLMDGAKADMVFTDPPYALFGNSTGVSGVGDDKMIMPFFRDIGRMIHHFLKSMGHAYVCHDWQTSATIKEAFGFLTPKNLIVWRKAEAGGLGTFYTKIYELIWLFANEPEKGIIGKTKVPARTINGVANIWDCSVVQARDRVHNAQKPVGVIKIAVENSSDKGERVLDLFGGSGSTLIACEQLDRTAYLMELEPKYCDVIVRRYMQVTGKQDVVLVRDGEEIPVKDTGILND